MRDFALLLHGGLGKCSLVSLLGKRVEAVKDKIGGCTGKYGGRMFFVKVACLAGILELSREVSKWTKQIVGFAKGGQQDPSPEAFKESELLWIRGSPYRAQ